MSWFLNLAKKLKKKEAATKKVVAVVAKKKTFKHRRTRRVDRGVGVGKFLPQRQVIKMEYVTSAALAKAIGAVSAIWRFKANNLYDPETDNVGRNGSYTAWAQLSAVYDKYKVLALDAEVSIFNVATTTAPIAITFSDETNPVTVADTISQLAARKNAIGKLICYEVPYKAKFHYDIRKQFGLQRYAFDDNYVGKFDGTAPTKQCYFTISLGEIGDGSSVATNVSLMVKIVATVQVFAPIEAFT